MRRFKARRKPVFFSYAEFNRLLHVQQFYWFSVDCFPEHLNISLHLAFFSYTALVSYSQYVSK
ncbi:MAG TPA: hypothetical protein VGJ92_01265, partial [Methanocella sp.]|jgi:hypothetical protein